MSEPVMLSPDMPEIRAEKSHLASIVYDVEARMQCPTNPIIEVSGQRFDGQWRRVRFTRSITGVPNGLYDPVASQHGYQSYESAMALGYWLLAAAGGGIEFRLIEFKIETDVKITRIVESDPTGKNYTGIRKANG